VFLLRGEQETAVGSHCRMPTRRNGYVFDTSRTCVPMKRQGSQHDVPLQSLKESSRVTRLSAERVTGK
jgi:hypothetical protein